MAGNTIPANTFERAMKALMDADPTQALFERTDRDSLRYKTVADCVRAVIEAIREPSDAMEQAGYGNSKGDPDNTGIVDNPRPDDAWRSMIDALLAEGATATATVTIIPDPNWDKQVY